ncbi:response regulator transcription factor [Mariniphaga sediminis]|uniref:response regulator transcription factor n=1 Tax=Mariniphaga sediminis TaxID=1628158 RepID=UPI000053557D
MLTHEILVLEDEGLLREEFVDILRFEGFHVIEASSGCNGFDLALRHHPDLILCDIMMSRLDGYATLEKSRNESSTSLISFIFMTDLADRNHMRKGMEIGANDYLAKPFTNKELLYAIQGRLRESSKLQCKVNQEVGYTINQFQYLTEMIAQKLAKPYALYCIGR